MNDILGAVIAFTSGVGISALNYFISKYFLQKRPDKFAMTTVIKQIINVAFLVAVYAISDYVPCKFMYLIIGAVLGITLPMLIFTRKLLKLNGQKHSDSVNEEGESDG